MATTNQPVLRGDTYWIKVQIDGKRLRKSLNTKDPKLAQEAFTRELADFYRTRQLKEVPKKTFKEACERWQKERGHKKSIKDDNDKIDYLLPKLGKVVVSNLTRDQIEAELPEHVTPSTRNRYRALIRAILRACEREWQWLDRAPSLRVEHEPRKRVAYLTKEQAEKLIEELPERYRNAVRIALLTGMRRANVFGMRWENVNLEKGMLVVEADETKAGSRLLVPLNAHAVAILESLPGPREGRVWGDMTEVWSSAWKAATKRAGVAWCRFHDLRHTWASWHAMNGTDLSVLQQLGGWHTPQMVQRYAHLSPEHLAEAAKRVAF
jgi:integrase